MVITEMLFRGISSESICQIGASYAGCHANLQNSYSQDFNVEQLSNRLTSSEVWTLKLLPPELKYYVPQSYRRFERLRCRYIKHR